MTDRNPTACAIIVAGGVGSRAMREPIDTANGQIKPKQLQDLGGKPVLIWSVEAFARDPRFTQIVIVCPDWMVEVIMETNLPAHVKFAPSGPTRTASVRSGLDLARQTDCDLVFIHDAARPGLDAATLSSLFGALVSGADGCAPTRPVGDALWHTTEDGLSVAQAREGLVRVQTPQAFWASRILAAYDQLPAGEERADDIAVAREAGLKIVSVAGSERLDKITWPEDFARMTTLLVPPLLPRVGTGYDAHRFGDGELVTLCGVEIAHPKGLAGHSDADVGWHALADAIYGALSAGDIGQHFPPSEVRWKGAASSVFLKHAGDMVRASNGVINHVDVTLVCEAPRVGPHRLAMIDATAAVLGLRPDQVSIKATTTEGMGFTGRREGIAAQASATILLPDSFRQASEVDR
jgi:2-C-methyl-D-erythritol 4-phosphate cytidylyltransferase / 2-C-methyl-D-erythritol 2,4-cyclodiphosphate synthase